MAKLLKAQLVSGELLVQAIELAVGMLDLALRSSNSAFWALNCWSIWSTESGWPEPAGLVRCRS